LVSFLRGSTRPLRELRGPPGVLERLLVPLAGSRRFCDIPILMQKPGTIKPGDLVKVHRYYQDSASPNYDYDTFVIALNDIVAKTHT
jgi:hypothetical protein